MVVKVCLENRCLHATRLLPIPSDISEDGAASIAREAIAAWAWREFNKPGICPSSVVDVRLTVSSGCARSISRTRTYSIGKDGNLRTIATSMGHYAAECVTA